MDRSPVAIVSVTTPPTLSAVTLFLLNDSRDTESYAHSQHIVQEISFAPEKPVPPMFAA